MEPVLDDSGKPVQGIKYTQDAEGATVKNRLWRGYFVCNFPDVELRLDRLCAEFMPRPDDVFIHAYMKCGSHWVHEICYFLLTGQVENRPIIKELAMLESEDLEGLEKIPSPRVLNCHIMRCPIMPEKLLTNHKVIYVVRNPKDTAVSLYHHVLGNDDYEYKGTFKGFLSLYEKGNLIGGSWFDYTRDFLTVLNRNQKPNNILMVEFEKLKRDPSTEIRRIADFLLGDRAATLSDDLLENICSKVSFSSMRHARSGDLSEFFSETAKKHGFYRKGEVGDWKNWFDAESSQRIDKLCAEALAGLEHLYQPIFE